MASPESEVSRESEELVLSPPNSPEEQYSGLEGENGEAGMSSPLSEIISGKNGKKEEPPSDEEGEASDDGEIKDEIEKNGDAEEGELEDGEVDDDEDGEKKSKSQVCKYYYKGQCTWGSHCRFIHPGFVDKGNYNMFEGLQKAPPVEPKAAQTKVQIARDLQRAPRTRSPPPGLLPPLGLPRLPIIPAEFFPPIPELPRRETMWEKGVKQARHLAQAAAKKRDAIEDKMHGLADRFDPEFDDLATGFPKRNNLLAEEALFPFNPDRRAFPTFTMRNPADFDQMTRERELRRFNNFMDQQNQLNFGRTNNLERRRSPPSNDLRKNLNEVRNQRQRAADEWQDPWMRSRSPGTRHNNSKVTDRWVRKSASPRSRSPKSPSRSASKISRTSRISEASEPRRRDSRRCSRSPKRQQVNRAPSGSPISSTRSESFNSKSPSPVPGPPRQQERQHDSPISSRASDVRGKRSMDERSSLAGRQAKRKHEGSPISSASSVDNDDGPRTPPPDDDSAAEDDSQRSFDERQNRRPQSGSPISPERSDDQPRRSSSPAEPTFAQRVKRLKKSHKPIKLTLQLKTDRRNALSALGPDGDEEEDVDANNSSQPEVLAHSKQSANMVDLDRSSPLSDGDSSQPHQTPSSASVAQPDSSDKQNKREELLRQLRAVEEAIARKKAVKMTD